MSRRALIRAALVGTAASLIPLGRPVSAQVAPPAPGTQIFFPETGHNIGFKFRSYYERNGGLELFGFPLTEVIIDGGMQVQYFERARFELRPELLDGVALSLLGTELIVGRPEPEFQWLPGDPANGGRFFPESGHTLRGAFQEYWERKNGLIAFGYPVSEELTEVGADGQPRTVQYFERTRFELHPENAFGAGSIQLGHLGRQALDRRSDLLYATAPVAPIALLGQATTGFRGSASERRINVQRSAALFDGVVVQPGEEHSFLGNHDFSEAAGFVEGYGIVGGKLDRVIGGGLCQVSTTLFRAVANAGLAITRRVGHTYVVYFYENIPGFDATVFSPSLDFRWRNDSSQPVTIISVVDLRSSTVSFELYGPGDGRTVSYTGPQISNQVQPGRAVWQYDPKLGAGTRLQLVHGRPGMQVRLGRMVSRPDGSTVHRDTFVTHYRPWADFWTFGPGVTPPAGVDVIRA